MSDDVIDSAASARSSLFAEPAPNGSQKPHCASCRTAAILSSGSSSSGTLRPADDLSTPPSPARLIVWVTASESRRSIASRHPAFKVKIPLGTHGGPRDQEERYTKDNILIDDDYCYGDSEEFNSIVSCNLQQRGEGARKKAAEAAYRLRARNNSNHGTKREWGETARAFPPVRAKFASLLPA